MSTPKPKESKIVSETQKEENKFPNLVTDKEKPKESRNVVQEEPSEPERKSERR